MARSAERLPVAIKVILIYKSATFINSKGREGNFPFLSRSHVVRKDDNTMTIDNSASAKQIADASRE